MTAALKLNLVSQEAELLSSKPHLGEKRPKLSLVWENPRLSTGTHKEKSKARLRVVSGQSLYSYVYGNPLKWVDPWGLEVRLCRRPAQILMGLVDHYWVETNTMSVGLGGNPNVRPGDEYEGPGTQTYPQDHSDDTATSCEIQNNVDEQCVNDVLSDSLGQPQGGFGPTSNCQQFAYSTVNRCRTGPQIRMSR